MHYRCTMHYFSLVRKDIQYSWFFTAVICRYRSNVQNLILKYTVHYLIRTENYNCMLISCQGRVSEWIYTLYLPECQGTPCSKQVPYLKFKWRQRDSNPKPFSLWTRTSPSSHTTHGWVLVYELIGCGFESRCCHLKVMTTLNLLFSKYRAALADF